MERIMGNLVRIISWILILICERLYGTCAPEECEVRLRLDSGWLCGLVRYAEDRTPYASFRGVPYAKPPLGERRFQELEPPEPWDHVYYATEDSAACPQKDFIYSRLPLQLKGQSEDCMYLNIHIPMTALPELQNISDDKPGVPIIVMAHGGGFQAGSGLTDMHGPEYLMRHEVIVISFNHRINLFGYLSLNTAKIPGNQGLRDIITLLRWVRRNSQAFGGDLENVTLLGHSTGAICAHLVSLSEQAQGLFHRIILMSGTAFPNPYTPSKAHAKAVANHFLAILGINSTDPDYIHERLVSEPIVNLMYALSIMQSKADILELNFVPVVEDEFPNVMRVIDDDPLILIGKGREKQSPMLLGFTTAEFNYFKLQLISSDIMKRVEQEPPLLLGARQREYSQEKRMSLATEVMKRYFLSTTNIDQVVKVYSDEYFVYPALTLARWKTLWRTPVYVYQFSYESKRNIIKEANWCNYTGVAHVEDLGYVFRFNGIMQNYVSHPPKNSDDLMKEWLPAHFVNFAKCSNPTCTEDEQQWPPLAPGNMEYQNIRLPYVYQMSNLTADQEDMMMFYDRIDEQVRYLFSMTESTNMNKSETLETSFKAAIVDRK